MNFVRNLAVWAAMLFTFVTAANAGTVSGRVTDQSGAPVFRVNVEVVYQTYNSDDLPYNGASIKASALTDGDGRYSISTDHLPPGEYSVNAFQTITNGGREINIDFQPEDSSTFAGNADTVRNFTGGIVEMSDELPYGNAGIFVLSNAIGDFTDLSAAVVTLTNVQTGKVLTKTLRPTGEGLTVTGIPFGTYTVTAALDGAPLQVKLWSPDAPDEYGPSVTHDFTMGWLGNQMQVAAQP